MPLVHVLHREYDGSLRMIIHDGTNPATLIQLVVKLVLPLKVQFLMSVMYPIVVAYVLSFFLEFTPSCPHS
jgi:hypothetical protein